MLRISNLSVSYGRMIAVKDIALTVEAGKLVALVGANGAGKSTTLRAISGLVKPQSGELKLADKSLVGLPAYKITRLGISHVPEGRGLFPSLSVDENLRLGALNRSDRKGFARDRDRMFAFFPALLERLHQPAGVLSGGEQQQLSIARAIVSAPKLLLIDELSLGLAPQLVSGLMTVLVELAKAGLGVLCVEQNTRMALMHADYCYVIENGRISKEGTGAVLLQDKSLVEAYLGNEEAD